MALLGPAVKIQRAFCCIFCCTCVLIAAIRVFPSWLKRAPLLSKELTLEREEASDKSRINGAEADSDNRRSRALGCEIGLSVVRTNEWAGLD